MWVSVAVAQIGGATPIAADAEFCLRIEKKTYFLGWHGAVVCINNEREASDPDLANGVGVSGFNFLLAYDPVCLTLQKVEPGQFLKDCQWEFFTYRFGPLGNCGGGCPSEFIRVVALADLNDARQYHPPPACSRRNSGQWVCLFFELTRDRTFENICCPIRWWFRDCTDNTISDSTGNVLWTVDSVYNAEGVPLDLATEYGSGVDVSNCVSSGGQTKKRVVLKDGEICIPAEPAVDMPGDLNLNGLRFEIGDAVLFENYLLQGLSALSPDPQRRQAQIASADMNRDRQINLADLVYLLCVILGDCQFPPPPQKPAVGVSAGVTIDLIPQGREVAVLSDNRAVDLGGLLLVLKVNDTVADVSLTGKASGMTLRYLQAGDQLRILVDAHERGRYIAAGGGEILKITGVAAAEYVEAQAADRTGHPVTIGLAKPPLPVQFSLSQNRPNPFNPQTTIEFSLPLSSPVRLVIYNVAGQVVRTLLESDLPAGVHAVVWDGRNDQGIEVSSGIYFYQMAAGSFQETKKMVLLK